MTEVWFYHLEREPVENVLPGLLARGLARGLKMSVQTAAPERVKLLSEKLWAYDDVAFLAHGCEGEPEPARQPIYIASSVENPNGSDFRFFVDGAVPENLAALTRASLMFDGGDTASVAQARDLWRRFKAEGHVISYWKMDENSRWVNQAAGA